MIVPMPTRADVAEAERIVGDALPRAGAIAAPDRYCLVHAVANALSVAREEAMQRHYADLTEIETHLDHGCHMGDDVLYRDARIVLNLCRERLAELTNAPPETMP